MCFFGVSNHLGLRGKGTDVIAIADLCQAPSLSLAPANCCSAAKPHPGARAICKVPSSRSSNTPMHPSPRSCCGRFPRGLRWTPPSSRVCLGGYSVTIRPARQAKTSYGSRPRSSMFDNNGSGPTTRPAGGAATLASPAAMRAIGSSEPCCCQRTGRRSTKNTPW